MVLETKKILYRDLAIEWLNYKKDYIKESTHANYTTIMYNHLIPDIGDVYLSDINHNFLQQYILDKLKTGRVKSNSPLSEKMVKDIMMILKSSLRYAMNEDMMNQINLSFIYPKSQHKQKLYILSRREQRKITEYVLENPNPRNIGILISLYAGVRIGELCALKWSDLDFKNNIIHINKTLQRIYVKEGDNTTSKIVISPPKTVHSNREFQ